MKSGNVLTPVSNIFPEILCVASPVRSAVTTHPLTARPGTRKGLPAVPHLLLICDHFRHLLRILLTDLHVYPLPLRYRLKLIGTEYSHVAFCQDPTG